MRQTTSNDASVEFLYGTAAGRLLLKGIQKTHADRLMVRFLRSRLSKGVIRGYARTHGIALSDAQLHSFRTYHDFFLRGSDALTVDMAPTHLVSPCDGWLSRFPIAEDSSFSIKHSRYRLADLLQDEALARRLEGGDCLIFRLCASDYHHYCFIDDGIQHEPHRIEGVLHSVQPIVCEKLPVFVLNRRCWTLLETDHFGPVVQTEIGALVVGGIVNSHPVGRFRKGAEKGRFELAGSTIVLLFEKDRIALRADLTQALMHQAEVRVTYGSHIGDAV